MSDRILTSTKKILGIDESYTAFDVDIMTHINSAFSTLHQLGVGPEEGFMIDDAEATWEDFLDGDNRLNSVKTYVYLKVRSVFDPPATSFHTTAIKEEIKELEWRLNTVRETDQWTPPLGGPYVPSNGIIDGGEA